MTIYKLDSAWYCSTSGLSWYSMLKMTKVGIELLSDSDILHMIQKGTHGDISVISNRYEKTNNKYTTDKYDKKKY